MRFAHRPSVRRCAPPGGATGRRPGGSAAQSGEAPARGAALTAPRPGGGLTGRETRAGSRRRPDEPTGAPAPRTAVRTTATAVHGTRGAAAGRHRHGQDTDGHHARGETVRLRGTRHPGGGARTRRAGTAVAAAVVGSLIGAPHAAAAPQEPEPGGAAASVPDRKPDGPVPAVWPRPQELRPRGEPAAVGHEVALVADGDTDPYALDALRALLRDAGARVIADLRPGDALARHGLVVRAGGAAPPTRCARSRAAARRTCPPAATGWRSAASAGAGHGGAGRRGRDGLFHAAQTLRQLVTAPGGGTARLRRRDRARLAGHRRRAASPRASTGTPWTHAAAAGPARLPGPHQAEPLPLRARRRPVPAGRAGATPYPAGRARRRSARWPSGPARNHVTLGWAVSPGPERCASPRTHDRAGAAAQGGRHVGAGLAAPSSCSSRTSATANGTATRTPDAYGIGPRGGRAGAGRPGRRGRPPPGRAAPGRRAAVRAADGVLPGRRRRPTARRWPGASTRASRSRGPASAWCRAPSPAANWPRPARCSAAPAGHHGQLSRSTTTRRTGSSSGPYRGREPAVADRLRGPADQRHAAADRLPHPPVHRRRLRLEPARLPPGSPGGRPIDDLRRADDPAASRGRRCTRSPANDASSRARRPDGVGRICGRCSATFWARTRRRPPRHGGRPAAAPTRPSAARRVPHHAHRPAHRVPARSARRCDPWLAAVGAATARPASAPCDMLTAQARGDGAAAWGAAGRWSGCARRIAAAAGDVGKGVLRRLPAGGSLDRADAWTGAGGPHSRACAHRPGRRGGEPDRPDFRPRTRPLDAVTVLTGPAGRPRHGWRRTCRARAGGASGRLSGDRLDPDRRRTALRADALRLTWPEDAGRARRARDHPWFADAPAAALSLGRTETDAADRRRQRRPSTAELTRARARRRARPDHGRGADGASRCDAPRRATPCRAAARPTVPVTVDGGRGGAGPGATRSRSAFGGAGADADRAGVPAHRRPGPGARRRGRAPRATRRRTSRRPPPSTATADDPLVVPAEDGAWLQLELAHPAAARPAGAALAGRLRLPLPHPGLDRRPRLAHGGDRTGRRGRPGDRADGRAADTRFVRVQGDERATRFGCSLWSVEAYAVRDAD